MPDVRLPARPQTTGDRARPEARQAKLTLSPAAGNANTAFLDLQRMVGNRAVQRLLAEGPHGLAYGGRRGIAPIARMASQSHQRGVPHSRVQRHTTGKPHDHSSEISEIEKLVAAAPDVPEEALPEDVPGAIQQGQALGEEVGGVSGKPAAAAAVQEELAQTPEASGGELGGQESIGALGSYAASLERGDDTPPPPPPDSDDDIPPPPPEPEGGEEAAAEAPAKRPANLRTRHGNRAKAVTGPGTTVANIGSSATKFGLQVAGAASTGAKLAVTVLGYIAAGLSAIVSLFDLRAAISSGRKAKGLETVMAELKKANPGDAELINAVQYAIEQKYSKAKIRAVKAITGLTSAGITIGALAAGVSLAALATNPVGWGIAAVIVGVCALVGVGFMVYKLGRKLWKWWKGDLGVQRRSIAMRLYDKAMQGDASAAAAIKELGLDPVKMRARFAVPETEAQRKARLAGDHKAVKERHERHTRKVGESTDLVAAKNARITELQTEMATWKAKEATALADGNAIARNYGRRAGLAEAEIARLQVELKEAQDKLRERKHKLGSDSVQLAWKEHSKKQREDISFIERKLKK